MTDLHYLTYLILKSKMICRLPEQRQYPPIGNPLLLTNAYRLADFIVFHCPMECALKKE